VHRQTDAAAFAFLDAAKRIKSADANATVITVQNWIAWEDAPWDVAGLFRWIGQDYNHRHLDQVAEQADLIGFNYYHRRLATPFAAAELLDPRGIREGATQLYRRHGKPVVVMENGLGTDDDGARLAYHRAHLWQLHEAQRRGVDVRGYFAWSLLDNFEWALGYDVRYGLYRRTDAGLEAKPSAAWMARALTDAP
jgi:beta-glucosidase